MNNQPLSIEKYVDNHLSPKIIKKSQNINFTPFITKWIENISSNDIPHFTKENSKPFPSSLYSLIPETIRKKEITKLNQYTNVTFTSHDQEVTLFFSHTNTNTPSIKFIQHCIQVIHTLSDFAPKTCIQSSLHIYMYLTHAQKNIRHSEDVIIGEQNANTAFTTSCDPTQTSQKPKEIILFRQEEVFKVLIHELFHVLGMDFSNNQEQTQKTAQILREFLNINLPDLRLFETYTETWACILNTICISVWENQENIQKQIQKRFKKEQLFSLWQVSKIIHYNQITYDSLNQKCLKPKSCFLSQKTKRQNKTQNKTQKKTSNKPKREYKENTQIFCYFLLKSAVFQKIDNFITKFPPPFNKHHAEEKHSHAQVFAQFVLEAFQDTNFAQQLQKMSALYLKYFHTHPRKEQCMFDTMRQTVNEIDILS